jgi:hypothetical protein
MNDNRKPATPTYPTPREKCNCPPYRACPKCGKYMPRPPKEQA